MYCYNNFVKFLWYWIIWAFSFESILLPIKFKADRNNFDQSLTSNHLFIESAVKQPTQNESLLNDFYFDAALWLT